MTEQAPRSQASVAVWGGEDRDVVAAAWSGTVLVFVGFATLRSALAAPPDRQGA